MKPLVIYHDSCADGFGAAFAAWRKFGDDAEYLPMQYGARAEVRPPIDGRDVYILDFSYDRQRMGIIFRDAARVVWLDHHASVFKDWGVPLDDVADELTMGLVQPNRHHVCLDNNKSGAILAWEYFHPNTEIPMMIRHIDDRDRWQFKIAGTKEFSAALFSHQPWSFWQWDSFLGFHNMYVEGKAILRAHNQNVQSVVKQARKCAVLHIDGTEDGHYGDTTLVRYTGLAANCPPHLASDVGHALATQSGTFGLLWYVDGDSQCNCSLRSNGDYDVSAIAKAFGGGGHTNAAGFSTNIDTLMGWLK